MTPASHFQTLSLENLFKFNCPVFNAEVSMRSCVLVREKVYKGEKFETRKGCQACVRLSKCPAGELVRRMAFNDPSATDACASDTETVGKLPGDVLEKIGAVLVEERDLRPYGLPDAERDLILSADARITAQMGTAPRAKVEARATVRAGKKVARRTVTPAPEPVEAAKPTNSVVEAARSGNLSAAINEGE